MATTALVIALISLVLAAIAYWRSGGKEDFARARQEINNEIEKLRAKQSELAASVSDAIAAAYEESRRRLRRARMRLNELREETIEGLQKQIDYAIGQLNTLEQRLEEGAKAVANSTIAVARGVEQGIAQRVHRVEARTTLLIAKGHVIRAVSLAQKREFDKAEGHLEDAAELLRNARATLGDDHAYEEKLDAMKDALRDATTAVRARAEDMRRQIEVVLTEADRLVGGLESDEQQAQGK